MIQGQDDIVILPGVFALTAISKGLPIKIVALYHPVIPMGFISFPENALRTPKDFEGKSVAYSVGETAVTYLEVLCRLNNVDCSKIKKIQMNPQVRYPQFVQKQVDTVSVYYTDALPILESANKVQFALLDLPRYGVKVPGLAFATSEATLSRRSDVFKRFVKVVDQSIRDSKADPEAATQAMLKHWSNHPAPHIVRAQVKATLEAMPEISGRPYGWVDSGRLAEALVMMKSVGEIDGSRAVDAYFTNVLFDTTQKP
jgi:NitT/TauT family transport system substrate-binding protein